MTPISSASPRATSSSRSSWPLLPTTPLQLSPHRRKGNPRRRKKAYSKYSGVDLSHELERISGVDLTRIDGIEVMVAQTILSEVGLDNGPVENRGPLLLLLVGTMPAQPYQW